ncbi:MAG: LptF/LptG family permease [Puniceicoccales bacterium]|jgi:lipopolysaccharide export LptBFGC system permease protein LptF|nr:LptF/LptG family permease [Puniceicoccales bacterium]
MKYLDRYIFFKFTNKFILFFIVLNAFLLCSDTYTHLENFLRHHIPFRDIFYHYIAQGIIYLPLILPLTFVMALIFVFITMQRNNEITALLSSGISFFKVMRMLWFLGFIGSAVLLWGNLYWIPKAYEYSTHYLENLEKNNADGNTLFAKHLTLNTQNRLCYINRYDKIENRAFGIAVHEYDSKGKEYRRIAAQSGYFDEETHAWTLEQGREILFHPKKQVPDEIHVFERCVFSELNDSPKLMLLLQLPVQNLSLPQLQKVIEVQKAIGQDKSYKMRFWDLILKSTFCFLSCWIVFPVLFSTFGKNYWRGVMRLSTLLLAYGVLSYTLCTLGISGAIHWLCASLIPFGFLLLMPLLWIRKLC